MKVLVLFIHSLVFVKAAVDFHLQSVNVFARLAVVEADMRAGIGAVEADIVFLFQMLHEELVHLARAALLKQSAEAELDLPVVLHDVADFRWH